MITTDGTRAEHTIPMEQTDTFTIRRLIATSIMLVLAIFATGDIWRDIINIALKDEEASQIFLVLPIFAWLIAVRRSQLDDIGIRYSLLGPVMIGLGWLISESGYRASFQAIWHFGALLVVMGALVTMLGTGLIRRYPAAFFVLVFLIPVPGMFRQSFAIPLQEITALFSSTALDLIGIETLRNGNVIIYNDTQVAVAEACNGMRMVFALILVSYAYAFINPLKGWVRLGIILLSPAVAIICNVLRLVPTVIVYGHFSTSFAKQFHDWSGWVMLVVAFFILAGTIRVLQWLQIPVLQHERFEE